MTDNKFDFEYINHSKFDFEYIKQYIIKDTKKYIYRRFIETITDFYNCKNNITKTYGNYIRIALLTGCKIKPEAFKEEFVKDVLFENFNVPKENISVVFSENTVDGIIHYNCHIIIELNI